MVDVERPTVVAQLPRAGWKVLGVLFANDLDNVVVVGATGKITLTWNTMTAQYEAAKPA